MQFWVTKWFTTSVRVSHLRLVGSGMPPIIDLEAIHVHRNTVEHPHRMLSNQEPPPPIPLSAAASTGMLRRMFRQIGMDRNVQMMRHKPTHQRKPGLLTKVSQCWKLLVWPTTPRLEKAFQRHQSLTRALTRDIKVRSPAQT